jgi:hypothetical protein
MSVLLSIFALLQAIGAIIGAGGSVVGELAYLKAMQDQRIDHAEAAHLRLIARALRWGMGLVLVGSIGLVVLDYGYGAVLQPALTSGYWLEMTLVLLIITASWALSRRRIAFWLGSSAAFAAWWYLALLDLGMAPALGYGASLAVYVLATAIIAAILSYARMLTSRT